MSIDSMRTFFFLVFARLFVLMAEVRCAANIIIIASLFRSRLHVAVRYECAVLSVSTELV